MKKLNKLLYIFIYFLLCTSFTLSQSKTQMDSSIIRNDTSIVKNVFDGELTVENDSNNNLGSLLLQLLPYIIALAGVGISAYALFNQRAITQKQINAELKRKFVNDMIEQIKLISKLTFTFFEITNDFQISKKKCDDLFKMIEYNKEKETKDSDLEKELLSASKYQMHMAETNFNQIYQLSKEFYYNVGSIFLYLPRNHKDYESLRTLSNQLDKSFTEYMNCFALNYTPEQDDSNKEKTKELGDKLNNDFSLLEDKIQYIIDEERASIENIFSKPK